MSRDELLQVFISNQRELISEIRELKGALRVSSATTVDRNTALSLLGQKNRRMLPWFAKQGLLSPIPQGAKGFIYDKLEILVLSEKIRNREIQIPTQNQLKSH